MSALKGALSHNIFAFSKPEFEPLSPPIQGQFVQNYQGINKGSQHCNVPCRIGLFVSAAAWAIGADPKPDSLEKMPRATPIRNASINVEPAKSAFAVVKSAIDYQSYCSWNFRNMSNQYTKGRYDIYNSHEWH